jgi:hypothetical protein
LVTAVTVVTGEVLRVRRQKKSRLTISELQTLGANPELLAKASLDDRWAEEDQIRENYQTFKQELKVLEERRGELEEAVSKLQGPNASRKSAPHPAEAELFQRAQIRRSIEEAMIPLSELDKLATRIRSKLDSFKARAQTHRSESQALSDQIFVDTHQQKTAERDERRREARELANRGAGSKAARL